MQLLTACSTKEHDRFLSIVHASLRYNIKATVTKKINQYLKKKIWPQKSKTENLCPFVSKEIFGCELVCHIWWIINKSLWTEFRNEKCTSNHLSCTYYKAWLVTLLPCFCSRQIDKLIEIKLYWLFSVHTQKDLCKWVKDNLDSICFWPGRGQGLEHGATPGLLPPGVLALPGEADHQVVPPLVVQDVLLGGQASLKSVPDALKLLRLSLKCDVISEN